MTAFYPGDDPYWEAVDLHYLYVIVMFCVASLMYFDHAARRRTLSGTIRSKFEQREGRCKYGLIKLKTMD